MNETRIKVARAIEEGRPGDLARGLDELAVPQALEDETVIGCVCGGVGEGLVIGIVVAVKFAVVSLVAWLRLGRSEER